MRFKIGEQIVCLKKSWYIYPSKESTSGPAFHEIVTVHSYDSLSTLILDEYRYDPKYGKECNFPEDCFAPLADISELKEILEQQPETVCHSTP